MVPSHVWRLTPDGEPIFFNKRMVDFLGLDVADTDKPGMSRWTAVIETASIRTMQRRSGTRSATASPPASLLRCGIACAVPTASIAGCRAARSRCGIRTGASSSGTASVTTSTTRCTPKRRCGGASGSLQQMIDAVPVRIWSATPTGGPVYFNKRYQDHFRSVIANFEAIEEPRIEELLQELIHPEDAPEVQTHATELFRNRRRSAMRFRWREKDGAYRWAECRVEPRRDQDGAVVEWYGVSLDIDDEVRAQEALRDREHELSQLVNMVPVHIRRLTPEGEPIFFNKRLLDFFGLNDLAQLDKPDMSRLAAAIQTLVHPDDAPRLIDTVRHSLATGEPYSMKYRMRHADGGIDGSTAAGSRCGTTAVRSCNGTQFPSTSMGKFGRRKSCVWRKKV